MTDDRSSVLNTLFGWRKRAAAEEDAAAGTASPVLAEARTAAQMTEAASQRLQTLLADHDHQRRSTAQLYTLLDHLPLRVWCKVYDPAHDVMRMLWISQAYAKEWPWTRKYVGRTDAEQFGHVTARFFLHNDRGAYELGGEPLDTYEWVPDQPREQAEGRVWNIRKVCIPHTDPFQIMGCAWDPSDVFPTMRAAYGEHPALIGKARELNR